MFSVLSCWQKKILYIFLLFFQPTSVTPHVIMGQTNKQKQNKHTDKKKIIQRTQNIKLFSSSFGNEDNGLRGGEIRK